jgi:hypothetical protein
MSLKVEAEMQILRSFNYQRVSFGTLSLQMNDINIFYVIYENNESRFKYTRTM